MLDKALAAISLASLAVFVGVLITYISEIDLVVVSVVVLVMAAYDFVLLARSPPSGERPADDQALR